MVPHLDQGKRLLRLLPNITAMSLRIDAGLAPKTVQTLAEHSSLQVIMNCYGHLFPSDDHKAAMDAIAGELMR